MAELIAVLTITILAVISPGADFAMVTRNSYLYGRSSGLLSALGIALGVQVHVMYTILGMGLLIAHFPLLFSFVKIIGATYLLYIGYRTFTAPTNMNIDLSNNQAQSKFVSFRTGFITNALNPKTMLFVISVYTQIVSSDTSLYVVIGYGLFMSVAHLAWFGFIALFFSNTTLRKLMISGQSVLNKVIGSVLISVGISLVFVSLTQTT